MLFRSLGWVARQQASNPTFERRTGVQARKLERVGSLIPGKPIRAAVKRQGPAARGSSRRKVEGGGDVKAFPRCAEGAPGGAEAHEGSGSVGT